MLVIQGSVRTTPRNHYITASLVITRVTSMTSPRRLIPTSAFRNISKNRKGTIKLVLITRLGSHKPMNSDTIEG
jgi:hypothetical protein